MILAIREFWSTKGEDSSIIEATPTITFRMAVHDAYEVLHAHKIVHGDVSEDNVISRDGFAKIIDFERSHIGSQAQLGQEMRIVQEVFSDYEYW